jgi:hypothetical protein
MRTATASTFAIATLAALALGMTPIAQAADKGCNAGSLKGSYAYSGTGTIVSPAEIAGPLVNVMVETFDGAGNLTATGMLTQNGSAAPVTAKGTYTVNNDCTGSMTVHYSLGFDSTFYFVMDDSLSELQIICLDAGVELAAVAKLQFPVGDWRQ